MSRQQWGHGFYTGVASATLNQSNLVGSFFHTRRKDGQIDWQGQVIKDIGNNQYLVQLYSWVDGGETSQKIVDRSEMVDWDFYATDKNMRFQYQKEQSDES